MRKFFRTYLPNRSSVEWAMTVPTGRGAVMTVGKPVQIIGGKSWGIHFMRHKEFVSAEEFWEAEK